MNMRATYYFFLVPLLLLSAHGAEPDYQRALEENLKVYPPGDYNDRPVRRFHNPVAEEVREKSKVEGAITTELLREVEMPDKDITALFSEAGSYSAQGRFALAAKRYKQCLLLEPDNLKAKANLYDITVIRCLYEAESPMQEINRKYEELKKKVSEDIVEPEK